MKVGKLSRHGPRGREGPVDPAGLDGVSSVPHSSNCRQEDIMERLKGKKQ